MAMRDHPKPKDMAGHHNQPGAQSSWKDKSQNDRTVPGAGTNKHASPGKLKEGNLTAHAGQPGGKSIGFEGRPNTTPSFGAKSALNGAGIFKANGGGGSPYCFRGTTKSGVLRMSGVKGAHRLGKK